MNVWLDSGHSLYNRVTAEHNRSFRFCSNFIFLMDFFFQQSFEKGQDKERAGRPDRVHTGIQNELCSGAIPDSCNLSRSTSSFQTHSPSKLHHFTSCSHCVVSDSWIDFSWDWHTICFLLVCLCIAAGRSFSWIPEEEGMLTMRDERRNKERWGYSVLSQWMDIGRLRFAIWPPVGTTALTARSVTNWRYLHCGILPLA